MAPIAPSVSATAATAVKNPAFSFINSPLEPQVPSDTPIEDSIVGEIYPPSDRSTRGYRNTGLYKSTLTNKTFDGYYSESPHSAVDNAPHSFLPVTSPYDATNACTYKDATHLKLPQRKSIKFSSDENVNTLLNAMNFAATPNDGRTKTENNGKGVAASTEASQILNATLSKNPPSTPFDALNASSRKEPNEAVKPSYCYTPASSPGSKNPTTVDLIVLCNSMGLLLGLLSTIGGIYLCVRCFGEDEVLFNGQLCETEQRWGGPFGIAVGLFALFISAWLIYTGKKDEV